MKKLTSIFILLTFVFTIFTQNILLARHQQSDKYSLAVLNLTVQGGNLTRTEARLLTGRLTQELEGGGLFFTMAQPDMERGLMVKNLDPYGCETIDCAVRAGRALGVQLVVIGTINQNDTIYSITLQMIHVASREVVKSLQDVYTGEVAGLLENMPVFAKKLLGLPVAEKSPQQQVAAPIGTETTYQKSSRFKWQYLGFGLLLAGGIGAGIYLAQKKNNDENNSTLPTATDLPGPPTFP